MQDDNSDYKYYILNLSGFASVYITNTYKF